MRRIQRNALILLTTAMAAGLFFVAPGENVEGKAPAQRRRVLRGTIKLKGDPPDLAALNKRLLEEMGKKDSDYCLKCADCEKTQQSYRLGGRDNKQVGNVFVWVKPETGGFFKVEEKQLADLKKQVDIRQPHCAFIPHSLFLFTVYHANPRKPKETTPTRANMLVHNDAAIAHNVNWCGQRNKGGNIILGPNQTYKIDNLLPESAPISIKCNIHPWMDAYLRIIDTPYYAISKSDTLDGKDKVDKESPEFGTYEIKNVPAGKVRILVWHERAGWLNTEAGKGEVIEVKAGEATTKNFELSAK